MPSNIKQPQITNKYISHAGVLPCIDLYQNIFTRIYRLHACIFTCCMHNVNKFIHKVCMGLFMFHHYKVGVMIHDVEDQKTKPVADISLNNDVEVVEFILLGGSLLFENSRVTQVSPVFHLQNDISCLRRASL